MKSIERIAFKPTYSIEVDNMNPECTAFKEGARYGLSAHKNIGDNLGMGSPCVSKEDIIEGIRHIVTEWLRYDSILDRYVEEPSCKNTFVKTEPKIITVGEVYSTIADAINKKKGVKTLKDFFG